MEHLCELLVTRNSENITYRFPRLLDQLNVKAKLLRILEQVNRLRDDQAQDRFTRETSLQSRGCHLFGRKLRTVLFEISDRLHGVPNTLSAGGVGHLQVFMVKLVASRFLG